MNLLNSAKLIDSAYALGLIIIGYFFAKRGSKLIAQALSNRLSLHLIMLVSKASFYLIFIIFFIAGLEYLGFNLNVLLGAAGIFTVALSFASQTAASNLISGIFLLFEKPFQIGDNIEVKGVTGIVESIDLLSTKIKTAENTLIRIPNETLIKSEITNLSFFNMRRIELIIGVAYSCDVAAVKSTLLGMLNDCEQVLSEPAPTVVVNNLADSAVELKILVWVNTQDAGAIKNLLQEAIKQKFDVQGIEIPFPQLTINWNPGLENSVIDHRR